MRNLAALTVLAASVILCFHGSAIDGVESKYSGPQAPAQLPLAYAEQTKFSEQLQGGILLRFEFGLIIVKPIELPESLQPTALTTDAIITSSVRSKIEGQAKLPAQNFEIQTDAGVVTIRAKGESLDQAAEVINLALCVPDVREIVYRMRTDKSSGVVGAVVSDSAGAS
jgi:hypothetical protein